MKKLPLNEGLTDVQKKLLLLWVEQGAKDASSKALRALGGFTLTDVKRVELWVKKVASKQ